MDKVHIIADFGLIICAIIKPKTHLKTVDHTGSGNVKFLMIGSLEVFFNMRLKFYLQVYMYTSISLIAQ